VVALDSRSDFS
jgi:hypothetical protein